MKKFAFAAVCVLGMVGFVMADEFNATVTKVEGNTVTYKKGGKMPEEAKADVTSDAKVFKGEFVVAAPDPAAKKGGKGGKGEWKKGDALEGALKNMAFTKIEDGKGIFCQITTNDAGKITQIVTTGMPKAGKKGG